MVVHLNTFKQICYGAITLRGLVAYVIACQIAEILFIQSASLNNEFKSFISERGTYSQHLRSLTIFLLQTDNKCL